VKDVDRHLFFDKVKSLAVGSRGKVPGGPEGRVPQKLKQNMKLVYDFLTFYVENLGFNEYKSRDWTVYFENTIFKKILKI